MKIGILTFHRAINYGAVAQCYVLCNRIKQDFPEDTVEVIDYVPKFREDHYRPSAYKFLTGSLSAKNSAVLNMKIFASKAKELVSRPGNLRLLKQRHKMFLKSMEFLPLSRESYRDNDVEAFRKKVAGKYDIIISGSDCVWEWSTIPLPNAYYQFGDFGAKKMSYAASAGIDEFEKLLKEDQQKLRAAIEEFSYVGVRDTSTEYVVSQASPETAVHHNCDPTTLLDTSALSKYREKVKNKLTTAGIDLSKPIVGIMGNEKLGKLARDIFGDSVQYVGVYVPNSFCDVMVMDITVLEWMAIFGLFGLTLTTFFHGTMLSLANHTPVLSFDYLPETKKQITKLHELYNRLDLPGFYNKGKRVFDEKDVAEIGKTAKDMLYTPPKERIAAELSKEAQSYNSFYNALKELRETSNETRL